MTTPAGTSNPAAELIDDFSSAFHDYGVLWTPPEMIFEIDGELAAVVTNNAVKGPTDVAFSSALIYAGVPDHPEGHDVTHGSKPRTMTLSPQDSAALPAACITQSLAPHRLNGCVSLGDLPVERLR